MDEAYTLMLEVLALEPIYQLHMPEGSPDGIQGHNYDENPGLFTTIHTLNSGSAE